MGFPFLRNEEIDAAASKLRFDALGQRAREPFVDLEAIVFDFLCDQDDSPSIDDEAELADEGGEEVLGKTVVRPGQILISKRLRGPREQGRFRFTLAHEIGHWILHRPLLIAALDQPDLFSELSGVGTLVTLNRSLTDASAPRHEIQANRFASTLLIDHETLREEFRSRFGDVRTVAKGGVVRERSRALAAAVVGGGKALADSFGVSVEAMAIALESRGYVSTPGSLFDS